MFIDGNLRFKEPVIDWILSKASFSAVNFMAARLNAWGVLRDCVISWLRNIPRVFSVSWPWLIILAASWMFFDYAVTFSLSDVFVYPFAILGLIFLAPWYLLLLVLHVIAFSSIAVTWHRHVLLGERAGLGSLLRFSVNMRRYFWNSVFLVLFQGLIVTVLLAAIALQWLMDGPGGTMLESLMLDPLTVAVSMFAVSALLSWVFLCLALKLPAVALGRKDFGFYRSWAHTRINLLPLFGLSACISFVWLIFDWMADAVERFAILANPPIDQLATSVFSALVAWLLGFLTINILTILYGLLIDDYDA